MPLDMCMVMLAIVVVIVAYYVLTLRDDIDIMSKKYDKVCYLLDIVGDIKDGGGKKVETKDFIDEILGDEK